MAQINLSQKKILTITAAVAVAFCVFWFVLYAPALERLDRLKKNFLDIENQIRQIEAAVGPDGNMEAGIASLNLRHQQLNAKFPQREEEGLHSLSDIARTSDIEILSVQSQPKKAFLGEDQQPVEVDGKSCQQLSITVEMKGQYGDIIRYIETLRNAPSAYVSIEHLELRRDSSETLRLHVKIDLNLYLLS